MKLKNYLLLICLIFFSCYTAFSETAVADSSIKNYNDTGSIALCKSEQAYEVINGKTLIYEKPRAFSFITDLPRDAAGIVSMTFKKKSVKPVLLIAGVTAVLIFADQSISDGVHQFSRNIHLSSDESSKDILQINVGKKSISLLKAPQNLNTALYQMGQGFPSLLIGAGLYTFGKIHNNYRALSTANQLAEAFILMGVSTQVLKRITGRQSPSEATSNGGTWHFFPSFKEFQKNTPKYDAFPSGHLATLMSTITILAKNYPEKKYIKPVGYSLMGLVGLSMINNNVHWASDYPLAIGLGYLCAAQVAKHSRKVVHTSAVKKNKSFVSFSLNYCNQKMMPGLIYHF